MNYFSIGDMNSGVYASQVIDVCRYLSATFEGQVRLVALISPRGFFRERKKIKSRYDRVWVLPAAPGKFWPLSLVPLAFAVLLLRRKSLMCRGMVATNLALRLRKLGLLKKVVFDCRGAQHHEWTHYDVGVPPGLVKAAFELEQTAIHNSDFRLTVSHAMVRHWKEKYKYEGEAQVVVPCTLNSTIPDADFSETELKRIREAKGYAIDDIILVYSGSTAGWQSLELVDRFLLALMEKQPEIKVLFLSRLELSQLETYRRFPDRVAKDWLKHEEVPGVLSMCDYGILIREQSVTNEVASPTKFAEYLSVGLSVLISEGIGDYTDYVRKHDCGKVISESEMAQLVLPRRTYAEKLKVKALREAFKKPAFRDAYERLLKAVK